MSVAVREGNARDAGHTNSLKTSLVSFAKIRGNSSESRSSMLSMVATQMNLKHSASPFNIFTSLIPIPSSHSGYCFAGLSNAEFCNVIVPPVPDAPAGPISDVFSDVFSDDFSSVIFSSDEDSDEGSVADDSVDSVVSDDSELDQ